MEQSVEVILKETITETVTVDQALQERVRGLVERALDEAEMILNFGLMDQKMVLIRTLLTASTRQLGKDFVSKENEARFALERVFDSMREVEEPDAAPTAAITPRIDYTNEGTDN